MNLKEAIKKIPTGGCTIFTGAGFSRGATNINNASPVPGESLSNLLYEKCGELSGDSNLASAAEFYIDEHGEHSLIELLRNEYTIREISDYHKLIGSLSWKRIYTTNYDEVFEMAYKENGKLITPVTLNDRVDYYKDKRTLCIHLNGFISRLTPDSLAGEFKLTTTSYLTTDFTKSRWVDLFRNDIESSKAVFFVGFSLSSDLDLSRILSANRARKNVFFIIGPNESRLNIKKLEKFGTTLSIGLNGFCEEIEKALDDFVLPEQDNRILSSFQELDINPNNVPKLRDVDVYDLFTKGDFNSDLIHYSLNQNSDFQYYLKRDELEEVRNAIIDGENNILIHSDLGNGKTLFLHGLVDFLIRDGYSCYIFRKHHDDTINEIEYLCKKEKAVLIIEGYSSQYDLLRKVDLFRTTDTKIIVTERSIINDTAYLSLEDYLFKNEYKTYDLNRLSRDEVKKLVEITSSFGFWGENAHLSVARKEQIIIEKFNSSFRLFLLEMMNSSDIKRRFNKILNTIKDANESFFEAVLFVLSSNYFDFRLDLDELVYILDDDLLNNPAFNNNDHLLEIIDFNNYSIKTKSSILSEAILANNIFRESLVPLLVKVVHRIDERRFDRNIFEILKKLVSFSRLQGLFNLEEDAKFKYNVISYFEEIKNTSFAKRNSFFWLQYAIARLSTRDYDISETYFKTAYSLAKEKEGFEPYQIDNHYARHIIENEIVNGTTDTCMERFIKAHNLLKKTGGNDKDKNKHYPLRVAINYGRFYTVFYKELKVDDQKLFLICCEEILEKIEDYKKSMQESRWNVAAESCESEIQRIFSKERP